MLFSVALLSVSLSIDAFGIGTSYGFRQISIPVLTKVIISIQSILITFLSLYLGNFLSELLPPFLSKSLGVMILILLGIWVIWQSRPKEESTPKKENTDTNIFTLLIKSWGITIQIVRTPQYCDLDSSSSIEPL